MGRTETEMGLTSSTTVLVTGGAGFIGSQVTAELLRRGRAVRVLDSFSTGKRENLAAVGGDVEVVAHAGRGPRGVASRCVGSTDEGLSGRSSPQVHDLPPHRRVEPSTLQDGGPSAEKQLGTVLGVVLRQSHILSLIG